MRSANPFNFHAPLSLNLAVSTVTKPKCVTECTYTQYNNLIEYCILKLECEVMYLNCSPGFLQFPYEQNEMWAFQRTSMP